MNDDLRMNWSVRSIAAIFLGNVLYALTVKVFLLPANLVSGGATGIALAANHLTGVSVSGFLFLVNMSMLILGLIVLGKAFVATTLASTFLYPLSLELLDRVLGDYILTQDILLCTIFSGLGIGMALGIVIRSGASTGGMDIPPLVLQKTVKLPVSITMYAFDVCILLSQALFRPAENILYGVVLVLIYTLVLDKMLLMGATRTEIKVISDKSDEIRDAILTQIDRGVTILNGESGYLHNPSPVILSVISNRELPKVEKLIHNIDPESFIVVSRVSEVRGRGFSQKKLYQ